MARQDTDGFVSPSSDRVDAALAKLARPRKSPETHVAAKWEQWKRARQSKELMPIWSLIWDVEAQLRAIEVGGGFFPTEWAEYVRRRDRRWAARRGAR